MLILLSRYHWQPDSKDRAFTLNTFHLNRAAMLFDDILHHRQPQTCPVSFGRKIRRKNRLQLIRGDPFPAIGNSDDNAVGPTFFCLYANRSLAANRMNSVQVQIQQHLSQPVRVSLNTLKRLIRREPQLNLSALGILTDQIQGVSNNIIEVNRLERQMRGLYQFEQFAYHPVQTVGLFGHHLRQFMRLAAGRRALGKVFRQPFDGRERVTNFVRDARRQMPHRHQLFFTLHCIKQFSVRALITLMPKKRQ
uniref:Enterotoxin n=3 Tax=Salmonella enterica TaxID=28901 RepID=S5PX72_SALTM|nr:enterotoxin [Salmonella enterica subsp. enterica serovar Typhimurium]